MKRAIPTLSFAALLLAACDKEPEAAPTDIGPVLRDSGVLIDRAVSDAVDAADAGDVAEVNDVVDAGDAVAVSDVTDAGDVTDVACAGDGGCWACAPSTREQFLNGCTASACSPFDNRARLPRLLADGGLPPLP